MSMTRKLPVLLAIAMTAFVVGCAETSMSTSAGVQRPLSSCDDLEVADQREWCIMKENEERPFDDE